MTMLDRRSSETHFYTYISRTQEDRKFKGGRWRVLVAHSEFELPRLQKNGNLKQVDTYLGNLKGNVSCKIFRSKQLIEVKIMNVSKITEAEQK